mgnify:CR=1 FL=1
MHWIPSFSLKDNQLFFDIWFLQSIPLFLILTFQPQSKEQRSHTKSLQISTWEVYNHKSASHLLPVLCNTHSRQNQSRQAHPLNPPVLYPEDQSVSCTQLLFRNNLRNRGPHSRWHQRKANPQYNHNDSSKPPYIQDR